MRMLAPAGGRFSSQQYSRQSVSPRGAQAGAGATLAATRVVARPRKARPAHRAPPAPRRRPPPQAAIQVTIDGTSYSARLNGTQAAESLKPLLPLTLSFRDFSAGFEEKIADLNQPLAYDQMPAGDDPAPGTSPTGLPANGSSSTGGMSPVTTASTSSGPSTRAAPSRPSGH